jgi:hypothetical protein
LLSDSHRWTILTGTDVWRTRRDSDRRVRAGRRAALAQSKSIGSGLTRPSGATLLVRQ